MEHPGKGLGSKNEFAVFYAWSVFKTRSQLFPQPPSLRFLLQASKPKRHNDFSSLEYFMTWILWVRKLIISCKLTKTLKKSESHLKKERPGKTSICTYFASYFLRPVDFPSSRLLTPWPMTFLQQKLVQFYFNFKALTPCNCAFVLSDSLCTGQKHWAFSWHWEAKDSEQVTKVDIFCQLLLTHRTHLTHSILFYQYLLI